MLALSDIERIIAGIRFKDWVFYIGEMGDEGWYLQCRFFEKDWSDPDASVLTHGRKWYLSPHATESEIVQTALKAVLTALEHEAREQFTYHDKAIFGPHFDVNALAEIVERKEVRQ